MQGIAVSYHCCRKCDGSVFNFYENDGSFGQFVLKNVVVLYICSVSMVYSPVLPALSFFEFDKNVIWEVEIFDCK